MASETNKLIFIVDDDLTFQTMMDDYLSTEYDTRIFSSGEDCLEHIKLNPDVIVLDYHLDGIEQKAANGMEILKAIKEIDPKQMVIILSGQQRFGVAAQMVLEGAEEYVVKDENAFEKTRKAIERFCQKSEA